jgi:hypothetical protein
MHRASSSESGLKQELCFGSPSWVQAGSPKLHDRAVQCAIMQLGALHRLAALQVQALQYRRTATKGD